MIFIHLLKKWFFLTTLLLLFFPVLVFGGKGARIEDGVVMNSAQDLLLYFVVADAFTADMEKGIKNGIPVTFTFHVELYEARKGWKDREISSISFDHTLTYDNLKEEYQISFSERKRGVTASTLEGAKESMVEINDFTVTSLDLLSDQSRYLLKIKAFLAKKALPLNFHYVIPFWNLWEFETDWYSLEFFYRQENKTKQAGAVLS